LLLDESRQKAEQELVALSLQLKEETDTKHQEISLLHHELKVLKELLFSQLDKHEKALADLQHVKETEKLIELSIIRIEELKDITVLQNEQINELQEEVEILKNDKTLQKYEIQELKRILSGDNNISTSSNSNGNSNAHTRFKNRLPIAGINSKDSANSPRKSPRILDALTHFEKR